MEPDEAEGADARAEAGLRTALNAVADGVALFDAQDRFTWWNGRFEQIFELNKGALRTGEGWSGFLRTGAEVGQFLDLPDDLTAWLKSPPEGQPRRERLPGDRWIRLQEHPTDGGGRIRTVTDTTGVKRTETSFRLMFEANPMPMSVVDARTLRFLAVNDAAVEQYGYPREAFLKLAMTDLAPPEVKGDVERIMRSDIGSYQGQAVWTQMDAQGRRLRIRPHVRRLTFEGRAALLCAAMLVGEGG